MDNIIECKLESIYKEIYTGLWRYDYGQILRITGVEFPKAVEIQFSLNEKSGSTITRIGTTVDGVTEVQIPNELLKNDGRTYDYCIYAYIYLTDETSGSTEYEIVLHVKSRTKPENPSEEPLPEPNIFHETVEAVNAAADRAEMAAESAEKSATSASETLEEIKRVTDGISEDIENANTAKSELSGMIESADDKKTELESTTGKASGVKSALDSSIESAGEKQTDLDVTVTQANTVDASLKEQIGSAGAIQENVKQIEKNTQDISSLNKEVAKNTANDADTKRKLDALWKLNQGISYEFQTDDTKAYQKDVPSGAKLASVKKIGGRTIVWNQLVAKQAESEHNYGLDFAWLDNGKIKISGTSTYTDEDPNVYTILKSIEVIGNHKYLFKLTGTDRFCILGYGVGSATPTAQKLIFNASDSGTENISIYGIVEKIQSGTVIDDVVCPQIYDLTKMFGAGNEPSTPEEFEAMFPADYYPYNAGEPMSAPVNEVMEQGKNYFDFSKLISDGVNVMDYEKQTITVPARTNNTGYNQTLRDLCPGITPGTYVFSMKRSNPESGTGSYFLEAAKDFPMDTQIELTDELLDNHIAWYNNPDSEVENVISEIQIEKNSTKTLYSQYYQKSHKIPQAILDLDGYGESGNFVDFVEKKYHKLDRTIDISDIIGDTFQEPFEVEAGGTLTFKNSHGDDYRIPVPSSVEYVISLAEVAK